jgi:oligoribonuclease (3'-5' exoribonuclease)
MLEAGFSLTDRDLNEVASASVQLSLDKVDLNSPGHDQNALAFHKENGLLDECRRSGLGLGDASHKITDWIDKHSAGGLYMAGSGLDFDRHWLKLWLPSVAGLFHRRNFDLNTLLAWYGVTDKELLPDYEYKHRAMLDIQRDIALTKRLAEFSGQMRH